MSKGCPLDRWTGQDSGLLDIPSSIYHSGPTVLSSPPVSHGHPLDIPHSVTRLVAPLSCQVRLSNRHLWTSMEHPTLTHWPGLNYSVHLSVVHLGEISAENIIPLNHFTVAVNFGMIILQIHKVNMVLVNSSLVPMQTPKGLGMRLSNDTLL